MGRIELIIGCMFSGKSSELIRRVRRYESISTNVLSINNDEDTRYEDNLNNIVTHDQVKQNAISVNKLLPLMLTQQYKDASIIAINEGQFFSDLADFCITSADYHNKTIIIAGLNGDYKREPFEEISRLMPHADEILKLSAMCKSCNNGTLASFTKKTIESTKLIEIGGDDMYEPVCRNCYNKDLKSAQSSQTLMETVKCY